MPGFIRISTGFILLLNSLSSQAAESLLDIYRLAEAGDPRFRNAGTEVNVVKENAPQARALLKPSASFDLNASKQWANGNSGNATATGYSISVKQPLYRQDAAIRVSQADAQILQSEAEYRSIQQDLIVSVARAYFNVLAAQDNLEFAKATKAAIQRQLDQSRQRFDVGLIAITDVQESKAAYDLAVADEINAENQLDVSYEVLRELTGKHHKELAGLSVDVPLTRPDPEDIAAWTETALEQNPSLEAALRAVDISKAEIKRQRAARRPTVDVVGQHAYNDVDSDSFNDGYNRSTSISLQLNMVLYQGGAIPSRIREAGLRHDQALNNVERQRRNVQRQARDAYLNVLSGISRVEALKQAVVSTKTAYQATQTGFDVGTRTSVEVLNSQRDVFRARRDYARARYDYILNTLVLKQAAGSLASDDLEALENWLK